MSTAPEIEKAGTLLAEMRRAYNLFAGAGFSVQARGASGPLPVGDQLAQRLRAEFSVDSPQGLSLAQLYVVIGATRPDELKQFIVDAFSVVDFDPEYRFLLRLPPKSILTTNVDNLFQTLFSESRTHYINDVYRSGASLSARSAVDLVQVHGSVADPEREMVFGPLDIASAFTVDPDRWNFLRQRLSDHPTLFWGYGFSDSGTLQAMHQRRGPHAAIGSAWVQVRPDDAAKGLIDYYKALGYNIIVSETQDLLEYFDKELQETSAPSIATVSDIENIPGPSEVPVRPREDFFTGAAPAWSDVYGSHLHRTAHFGEVVDRLHSRQSVLIGGIPGCGKTTLLMQIAAGWNTDQPKALYSHLSFSKAEMLARQIGDGRALLVLDDVASDIRVLDTFSKLPGVTILAADRDYAISSVHHRIPTTFDVLPVTGQSRSDLVRIWKTIPERLRKDRMSFPQVTWGVDPSLYEFIKSNVRNSFLSQRLSEHIVQLNSEESELAELLVLACHLMHARSALSTDVALAYFRPAGLAYEDLTDMIRKVGELLVEDGAFDSDQDYFTARSAIVGEEVVMGAPRALLHRVLVQFFEEVSPLRIPAYDAFVRRGFDARTFSHAFSSVAEGADLYDLIYERSPSVYVLQQKALFLENFGRYDEAFQEIETARNSWRGRRNLTIENTYNKLLFRLNFQKVGVAPEALDLCRRAIRGLRACYEQDARKGQHALVYSDCCLRLSDVVDDDILRRDLQTALEMLSDVMVNERYLDRPRYVRREVERRLARLGPA